jgi:hypothetical protein
MPVLIEEYDRCVIIPPSGYLGGDWLFNDCEILFKTVISS